jgi:hypothetical protein
VKQTLTAQLPARGGSRRRGGSIAGVVVAWGAAEQPDHGEAEVTGAEEERGRRCWRSSGRRRARVRVLGLRSLLL